ncbi:MAG: alpha/beta fold hydrolase [Candidatus Lokiarchaeota archaeon]|nr:alpha/beta fold hydrolase [Candidatus Lokiarchaeota archaeon]
MSKLEYKDYWFNYCFDVVPQKIKDLIKEEYISSQGLKIHLDIYDDKEKLFKGAIIFLHGTSVYSRFYAEFLYSLFSKGYRVIAPDMMGHGLSEGIRGHFTMDQFEKIVYDVNSYVIENYGVKSFLMGSSLGGINTLYSVAYDNRFKGAICHNAAIFNEKAYKKIINLSGILKLLIHLIPMAAKIAPKLKLNTTLYLDFDNLAKSERVLERINLLLKDPLISLKYTFKALRAQMRDPLPIPIEEIQVPIMIINGTEDVLFTVEYISKIYNRLMCKNKSLEILNGASHLIFQENIQEVLNRIIPWLEKIN